MIPTQTYVAELKRVGKSFAVVYQLAFSFFPVGDCCGTISNDGPSSLLSPALNSMMAQFERETVECRPQKEKRAHCNSLGRCTGSGTGLIVGRRTRTLRTRFFPLLAISHPVPSENAKW